MKNIFKNHASNSQNKRFEKIKQVKQFNKILIKLPLDDIKRA